MLFCALLKRGNPLLLQHTAFLLRTLTRCLDNLQGLLRSLVSMCACVICLCVCLCSCVCLCVCVCVCAGDLVCMFVLHTCSITVSSFLSMLYMFCFTCEIVLKIWNRFKHSHRFCTPPVRLLDGHINCSYNLIQKNKSHQQQWQYYDDNNNDNNNNKNRSTWSSHSVLALATLM